MRASPGYSSLDQNIHIYKETPPSIPEAVQEVVESEGGFEVSGEHERERGLWAAVSVGSRPSFDRSPSFQTAGMHGSNLLELVIRMSGVWCS